MSELAAAGVGLPTQRRVLVIVQGILQRAVEWDTSRRTRQGSCRKPTGWRRHVVRPMAPAVVERMRAHLLACSDMRSATLVSVLARGGVRPGEALALTFGDEQNSRRIVDGCVVCGQPQPNVALVPTLASRLRVIEDPHELLWSPHLAAAQSA